MFAKQTAIGINISDNSIEVMQLDRHQKVLAYGRGLLEKGIVSNGLIFNKEKLAAKIKEVLRITKPRPLIPEHDRRAALNAILSLPESQVFIHFFDINTYKKTDKMINEIDLEAQKIIPIDHQELVRDFLELHINPKTRSILYVGADKKMIEEYVNVLNAVGLNPIAFDLESASLGRALLPAGGHQQSAILDIGARTSILSIFDQHNHLIYSVTVPVAGNNFTELIEAKLGVSQEEAENLKRHFGFAIGPENKILLIIQKAFTEIIKEVREAVAYHERVSGQPISTIILTGGSSLLPKIDEYLALNLNKEVVLGPSPIFANVTGLALRAISKHPEEGINLLPEKKHALIKGEDVVSVISHYKVAVSLAAVLLLLVAGLSGYLMLDFNIDYEPVIAGETTPSSRVQILRAPFNALEVYVGPGENYRYVTIVQSGDNYPLLEESGDWVKIKITDQIQGWVSKQYIKIINNE